MKTRSVLECGSPLPLLNRSKDSALQSARGLAQSKTWRIVGALLLLLYFILLPSAFCLRASGQSYSIDWYKISGGGGTSSNGTYSVTGTIGQPEASGAMSGGPMIGTGYSLTGGFWSLISVVQTAGLPNLTITHGGNTVTVSWPDTSTNSYTLQQSANLALGNGWATSGYAISTNNGTCSITIPSPVGNWFFRLKQ